MYKDDKFCLLPEIQFDYALMDFDDIKISKKVSKLLQQNNYNFSINKKFDEVIDRIKVYHEDSWLKEEYIKILKSIRNNKAMYKNFKLISVELSEKNTDFLVSGEIGYEIDSIYTSLTGFTTKEKKFNNWGKLQLVLLNSHLKENNFKFWNLGHPQLLYKIDLGAKVYTREEFLKRLKTENK